MAQFPDSIHQRVREIFETALEEVGGPARLLEQGDQDLMPVLTQAALILVLGEEEHQSRGQIAEALGVSPGVVDSVFEAPMEAYQARLRYRSDPDEEFDPHTDPQWSGTPLTARRDAAYLAGALAKFAYGVVRRRHEMPA